MDKTRSRNKGPASSEELLNGFDAIVEHILIHYRWVFVIFLLPVSLLYDLWTHARNWVVFRLTSAPAKHAHKVRCVAAQVHQWRDRGSTQKMCTARPGWQTMCFRRPLYKNTMFNVQVNLVDILELDAEKSTVRVEPLVTMGQLTATLDPLGWTLPVLPEIDDLTVGGLVMGTGVETSSHKYGLFQHICVSYELVLSDGRTVVCSKESFKTHGYHVKSKRDAHREGVKGHESTSWKSRQNYTDRQRSRSSSSSSTSSSFERATSPLMFVGNFLHPRESQDSDPDLFHAVPWSHGTLGFLTAVEIKIIPALRFVKIEYEPVHSLDDAVSVFERQTFLEKGNDFIEAIMFSKDQGVVMTGNMVSCAELGKLNEIGKWYKPWFFEHVRSILSKPRTVEYIPLRDYQHRHTKSLFWEVEGIVPFGNNSVFRFLFGWMMPPKVSLLKLTQTKAISKLYNNNHILQDMLVPIKALKESIEVFHNEVQVYPLWLCPFHVPSEPGMLYNKQDVMYVDIGVYGVPKAPGFNPRDTTRKIEAHVMKVKGFQMLYADTYMTKEEFRRMFNHELYDEVRKKLNCEKAFPEVYEKVCRHARL